MKSRTLVDGDLDVILRIEAESHPNAWPLRVLKRWMAKPDVEGQVLEMDGIVRAFFMVDVEPRRIHLINLAVDPSFRRRGIGTRALELVDEVAEAHHLARIDLEVRETNLPAQLLYKKAGYLAVRILRNHYEGEDGYLMRKKRAPQGDT